MSTTSFSFLPSLFSLSAKVAQRCMKKRIEQKTENDFHVHAVPTNTTFHLQILRHKLRRPKSWNEFHFDCLLFFFVEVAGDISVVVVVKVNKN